MLGVRVTNSLNDVQTKLADMQFPRTFRLRQRFVSQRVDGISKTVHDELMKMGASEKVRAGQSVAITGGSRGINNIAEILAAAVDFFRKMNAKPFIFPAMGSHGGATAEGQRQVLETYGITESFCGCEIRSSMDTVSVAKSPDGYPIHFDKNAFQADHIVACNRIKLHTDFHGRVQSGLLKMLLIGCGKRNGANFYHRATEEYGFDHMVARNVPLVLDQCHVLGGLAIVENGYEETGIIEGIAASRLIDREPALLELSRQWMPKLPFEECDILLLDEMGKNISGTGMDTNVIGRKYQEHASDTRDSNRVKRIAVRGLSEESHGNATGIGFSEFCLTSLVQNMDLAATRMNCLTSGRVVLASPPIDFPNDQEMLSAALKTIGLKPPEQARLIWAHNTLDLIEVECSQAYFDEACGRKDLEILTELRGLPLSKAGHLPQMASLDRL